MTKVSNKGLWLRAARVARKYAKGYAMRSGLVAALLTSHPGQPACD